MRGKDRKEKATAGPRISERKAKTHREGLRQGVREGGREGGMKRDLVDFEELGIGGNGATASGRSLWKSAYGPEREEGKEEGRGRSLSRFDDFHPSFPLSMPPPLPVFLPSSLPPPPALPLPVLLRRISFPPSPSLSLLLSLSSLPFPLYLFPPYPLHTTTKRALPPSLPPSSLPLPPALTSSLPSFLPCRSPLLPLLPSRPPPILRSPRQRAQIWREACVHVSLLIPAFLFQDLMVREGRTKGWGHTGMREDNDAMTGGSTPSQRTPLSLSPPASPGSLTDPHSYQLPPFMHGRFHLGVLRDTQLPLSVSTASSSSSSCRAFTLFFYLYRYLVTFFPSLRSLQPEAHGPRSWSLPSSLFLLHARRFSLRIRHLTHRCHG